MDKQRGKNSKKEVADNKEEVRNMTATTRENHIFTIKLTEENKDKIPIISRKAIEEAKKVLLKYTIK